MPTPARRSFHSVVRRAALAACFALVGAARTAAAIDVSDPPLGMHVQVAPAGARVCVAFPEALRNAGTCADVRLPPAAMIRADVQANGSGPVAVMVLAFADMRVQLTIEQAVIPQAHAPTPAEAAPFVTDVRRGFARTLAPSAQRLVALQPGDGPERLTVNGVVVIRHVLRISGLRPDPNVQPCVLLLHAIGRAGIASLSFQTDAAHLPRVEALAREILATLAMPGAP